MSDCAYIRLYIVCATDYAYIGPHMHQTTRISERLSVILHMPQIVYYTADRLHIQLRYQTIHTPGYTWNGLYMPSTACASHSNYYDSRRTPTRLCMSQIACASRCVYLKLHMPLTVDTSGERHVAVGKTHWNICVSDCIYTRLPMHQAVHMSDYLSVRSHMPQAGCHTVGSVYLRLIYQTV
jgi:hypothetical protein